MRKNIIDKLSLHSYNKKEIFSLALVLIHMEWKMALDLSILDIKV